MTEKLVWRTIDRGDGYHANILIELKLLLLLFTFYNFVINSWIAFKLKFCTSRMNFI